MRHRAVALAIALAASAPASPVGAQQTDSLSQPHAEFMERAYLFKNVPDRKTGEWFEGLLPLHIPFHQNLQGVYDEVLKPSWSAKQTVAVYFSMVVNLRMTKENSAPVRTPSYMPKFTVTYFNVKRRDSTSRPMKAKSVRLWAVPFVPYGHYSNGQDGCLFATQREDASKVCRDTATTPHPAIVNRRDGSFSSHYMQLGVFYRRIALDDRAQQADYAVAKSYWSVGGQVRAYQPYYWLGGGMSRELRALYGPTRVRALVNNVTQRSAGRIFGPGQVRYEAFVEWLGGSRSPRVDPFRFSVEAARTMDKRGGWGVFARAYAGQDDYNLGFLTNLRVAQFGVTTSGERMPSFRF